MTVIRAEGPASYLGGKSYGTQKIVISGDRMVREYQCDDPDFLDFVQWHIRMGAGCIISQSCPEAGTMLQAYAALFFFFRYDDITVEGSLTGIEESGTRFEETSSIRAEGPVRSYLHGLETLTGTRKITITGDKNLMVRDIRCEDRAFVTLVRACIDSASGYIANCYHPDPGTMLQAYATLVCIFRNYGDVEAKGDIGSIPYDPEFEKNGGVY